MVERHAREFQEGEHLEPVAVVVGDAEQGGIGIERQHGTSIPARSLQRKRPMKLRSSASIDASGKKSGLEDQYLQTPFFISPLLTARAASKVATCLLTAM